MNKKQLDILQESLWIVMVSIFYFSYAWCEIINLFFVLCTINEIYEIIFRNTIIDIVLSICGLCIMISNLIYFYDLTMLILFINTIVRYIERLIMYKNYFLKKDLYVFICEYLISTYIFWKLYGLKSVVIIFCGVIMRHLLHTNNVEKKIFLKKMVGVYYTLLFHNLCLGGLFLLSN